MYLDDVAEQIRKYKVVMYLDNFLDPRDIHYYDDLEIATKYYKTRLFEDTYAKYTATVALVEVPTGVPLLRQTWRVNYYA
jgi:hypothetical protein